MNDSLTELAKHLGDLLHARGQRLALAESCTGGWAAKVCTDLAGSSDWFECSFVTYSNNAKQTMLGVLPKTLTKAGAVSEAVVCEMAQGALKQSAADWAVAISGVAGPGGGSEDKPVGSVWFAWAGPEEWLCARCELFSGSRDTVRRQSVQIALSVLLDQLV